MVLTMLRCSVVGKWTGGAVGAKTGKLIRDYKVLGVLGSPVLFVSDLAEADQQD